MDEKSINPSLKRTVFEVFKIGFPAIIQMISYYLVNVINVIFSGHLGEEAIMSGVGMAVMWCNIVCLSLTYGFNCTLNTYVSQAFGFKDYRMCGVYHNRGRIISTIVFVPLAFLLLHTEGLFTAFGFDPLAAAYSQIYINRYIPGLYFLSMWDLNRKFLANMGHQTGPTIIQVCITTLHVLWCYILTDALEMGIRGTAIASTLTNFLGFVAYYVYSARFAEERLR